MKNSFKLFIAIASLLSVYIVGCKKNNSAGTSRMTVSLTDDPSAYDAVNIDIEDIQVNSSGDSGAQSGWISLPLNRKGVYNLLDFKNGIDTLLTSQELPAGTISQIRLVLGNNNSIIVNGLTLPLSTPSAEQSGLKLNVHATLIAGVEYKIWLDFDAGRSIVLTGNGSFELKPVIRTYTNATSGAIKGMILSPGVRSMAFAIQNVTDTIGTAIADSATGNFLIGGLPAGNYHVAIHAADTYMDSTISTSVTTGLVTDLGSIELH
jgi:hypothetical protein